MTPPRKRLAKSNLRKMIDEATVDAYNESEQEAGLFTMLEEHLRCPVQALVVGEAVEVLGFDFGPAGRGIVAKCRRKGRRYTLSVLELEWPSPPPQGVQWIKAYRAWIEGAW